MRAEIMCPTLGAKVFYVSNFIERFVTGSWVKKKKND